MKKVLLLLIVCSSLSSCGLFKKSRCSKCPEFTQLEAEKPNAEICHQEIIE